ncbi:MAG: transglutaminase N-terminal domain-containing protein [Hyphomicrobium sp.]
MLVSIGHVTRYTYSTPAVASIYTLRLTPPSYEGQRVLSWRAEMPGIEDAVRYRDAFGNVCHLVSLPRRALRHRHHRPWHRRDAGQGGFRAWTDGGLAGARLSPPDGEDGPPTRASPSWWRALNLPTASTACTS